MKVRNTGRNEGERIELQMTPMIDIVFQLLVFFIMTFKIVAAEGDFHIKMPQAERSAGLVYMDQLPPIRLRLTATGAGDLSGISLNGTSLGSWPEVNLQIIGRLGGDDRLLESAEVEIDSDFNLNYEHVIAAVTAVSGYYDEEGRVVTLVEKIKFTPPGRP